MKKVYFSVFSKNLQRNIKMVFFVFDYMKTNAFLETFGLMQAPLITNAVVARTIVFSVFINQVFWIHALGVVAEMRSVILLVFNVQQLEESLSNSSRVLGKEDSIGSEKSGKVENNTAAVVVVDAKVSSFARLERFPTTSVDVDRREIGEVLLEFLDEVELFDLGEIFKFLELQVDNFSGCCFAHVFRVILLKKFCLALEKKNPFFSASQIVSKITSSPPS